MIEQDAFFKSDADSKRHQRKQKAGVASITVSKVKLSHDQCEILPQILANYFSNKISPPDKAQKRGYKVSRSADHIPATSGSFDCTTPTVEGQIAKGTCLLTAATTFKKKFELMEILLKDREVKKLKYEHMAKNFKKSDSDVEKKGGFG